MYRITYPDTFLLLFEQLQQGFKVVVVGINDAGVDFAAGRMMAGGMEEEGDVAVAALVAVGAEVTEHREGCIAVGRSLFTFNVVA